MPLDPSIILGGQAPQIKTPDPLDQATKLMNLKDLVLQSNALQKTASDSSTMSDILKRNTTVDPNTGAATINKQSALSDLYKANPLKAMDLQKQWAQEDFDAAKKRTERSKDLAWSIAPDGSNYSDVVQQAIREGIPHADKLPPVYDPNIVNSLQMSTLSAAEQIKKMESDRSADQKDRELDTKEDENQIKREQMHTDNYQKYVQHVEDDLKSFRGDPATTAASMKISAAAGAKPILDKYRDDFNKMPIQDIAALTVEKMKSITGTTPGEQEVEHQLPSTGATKLAWLKSQATGNPEPANAGDFVKAMDEGFKDQEASGRQFMAKRQADIAGDPRLKPADKERLSQSIIPPKVYTDDHPQDAMAVQWAQKNIKGPNAAKAQAILKANGVQ